MRIHIFIFGLVQGVFFRAYLKKQAEKLNLTGWVKNLPNGRVEAIFEGAEKQIKTIIKLCQKGSLASRVEKIEVVKEKEKGLRKFEIKR